MAAGLLMLRAIQCSGGGLNPNSFTTDWCDSFSGLPLSHGNLFLPYPGQPNKYVLFHQTGNYMANLASTELYYSVIDMSLHGGLGAVIHKNQIALTDNLGWGISACKHANGQDWWIVVVDFQEHYFQILSLDSTGVGSAVKQTLSNTSPNSDFAGQPLFSPDGKKLALTTSFGMSNGYWYHDVRIYDFDRCSGVFSNQQIIDLTDSFPALGTCFSSNSKYLYSTSTQKTFQLCLDSPNVATSKQIVAVNDGYYSPYFPYQSDFWLMYLAANGKIYLSSGSAIVDMHFINYPDSAGLACDVHLHDLHLPCWSGRGNVNHPNYYLGCDTTSSCPCLTTSLNELGQHNFKFSLSPNPTNGNIKIMYLLPQNSKGVFEVYDVTGQKVYSQQLPPWSTLQSISLPQLSNGVYNCVITSANQRVSKKIAVIK